jgi:hypothetical protein
MEFNSNFTITISDLDAPLAPTLYPSACSGFFNLSSGFYASAFSTFPLSLQYGLQSRDFFI